jgi:hypothetical protein
LMDSPVYGDFLSWSVACYHASVSLRRNHDGGGGNPGKVGAGGTAAPLFSKALA